MLSKLLTARPGRKVPLNAGVNQKLYNEEDPWWKSLLKTRFTLLIKQNAFSCLAYFKHIVGQNKWGFA
jgi:hypothetical protein